MCGRYTLRSKPKTIAEEFDLRKSRHFNPALTRPGPACKPGDRLTSFHDAGTS